MTNWNPFLWQNQPSQLERDKQRREKLSELARKLVQQTYQHQQQQAKHLQQQALQAGRQTAQQAIQQGVLTSGQYWKPGTQAHSGPTPGASKGAGGATTSFTTTGLVALFSTGNPTHAEQPAVPYAGIRTGEIIGQRFWWVLIGADNTPVLSSFAHLRVWKPGETVSGNIHTFVDYPILGGVYSFFDDPQNCAHIADEIAVTCEAIRGVQNFFRIPSFATDGGRADFQGPRGCGTFVQGTIKMWGNVVEHIQGWRAEHAKVVSLNSLHGHRADDLRLLHDLRTHYGCYGQTSD